jgi:hypothetical protein
LPQEHGFTNAIIGGGKTFGSKLYYWSLILVRRLSMKFLKPTHFIAIFAFCCVLGSVSFGHEDLTPQQLVLLMRASSEQYISICAKINGTGYQMPTNIKFTQQIISRWTREKEFIKIVEASNYDSVAGKTTSSLNTTNTDTYSISPAWSKRLMEVSGSRTVKGLISSTSETRGALPCYTLYTAMWELGGYPWDLIQLDGAEISYNEKEGLYILRAKITDNPKGPKIRLYVDPSKGYIPVKQENMTYEDVCFIRYECSDFHQLGDGLWIPYQYSWVDPRLNYSVIYKAGDVVVNKPIADSLLDFEFPEGAIVTDERIGSEYRVPKTTKGAETSAKPVLQNPAEPNSKVALPVPATNDKLRSTAAKARELLAASSVAEAEVKKIEVFPAYVYVKPDKTQYILSVKSNDSKKCVLTAHTFESDKMKLLSLKDQIAEQGTIIINIQRQANDSGFEEGTLNLKFTDGDFKVKFVSPPLSVD